MISFPSVFACLPLCLSSRGKEMKIVLNQKKEEKQRFHDDDDNDEKKEKGWSSFSQKKKHNEKKWKNPCQAMLLFFCRCVPHTFYKLIIK
jgi:hypothetical protein